LIYAVNPADNPPTGEDVPTARNLTDLKNVRAFIYAAPRNDPDAMYVGINDRDPAWHDLYKIKILYRRAHARAQEYRTRHRLDF
jgi:hypothetical protein